MTREEILAYQAARDIFRATAIGKAFFKFKHALMTAQTADTEDMLSDKDRASTKLAIEAAVVAEKELLALLNAPAELTGGAK